MKDLTFTGGHMLFRTEGSNLTPFVQNSANDQMSEFVDTVLIFPTGTKKKIKKNWLLRINCTLKLLPPLYSYIELAGYYVKLSITWLRYLMPNSIYSSLSDNLQQI